MTTAARSLETLPKGGDLRRSPMINTLTGLRGEWNRSISRHHPLRGGLASAPCPPIHERQRFKGGMEKGLRVWLAIARYSMGELALPMLARSGIYFFINFF